MNGQMQRRSEPLFAATASRRRAMRALSGVGFGALMLLGSSRRTAAHEADEVALEAIDALSQTLASGDVSGLDAVYASEVLVQPRHRLFATGAEVPPGLEGLKAALEDIRGIASDVAITVEDVIAEEDKAAGRFAFQASLAASGQPLAGSGLFYLVIADDRVTELWIYPDPASVMAVMGIPGMATPVAASEAAGRAVLVAGGSYLDIGPAELAAVLPGKTFPLINVHVPYEGEIEGTDLFIPFDRIELQRDELPGDLGARIVLYCRTGRMSAVAAETLVKLGYADVWNLAGGMVEWERAGFQLVYADR